MLQCMSLLHRLPTKPVLQGNTGNKYNGYSSVDVARLFLYLIVVLNDKIVDLFALRIIFYRLIRQPVGNGLSASSYLLVTTFSDKISNIYTEIVGLY